METSKLIANNVEPFCPTHPGIIIKEELEYRGISQRELAKGMGVSYSQMNEVLNGKRPLNTELSLLLEAALGIDAEPLMNMQIRYNILTAKRNATFQAKLNSVRRIAASITL